MSATDLSFRSPKTEVRPSTIHGLGLFATSPIARGEIVAVKGGYIVPRAVWRELEPELGSAEIQIAEDLFIAPRTREERDGSMLFLNHSCAPNCALQGQIVVVAMTDVVAGEELTHDWATTDDLDYEMACNCGSPGCRGTITGKDWMREDLQRKYAGWFCWHIQRKLSGR